MENDGKWQPPRHSAGVGRVALLRKADNSIKWLLEGYGGGGGISAQSRPRLALIGQEKVFSLHEVRIALLIHESSSGNGERKAAGA